MVTAIIGLNPSLRGNREGGERGFSLIEVMISITILTVGMLALLAVFAGAVASTSSAQEDLIAKQKSMEAMESLYTARNTQQLGFRSIANTNAAGGIFKIGYQPLLAPGPDGLVGTGDDTSYPGCPGGVECIVLPGPDGILGTSDDVQMSLTNFQRQIIITNVLLPDGTPNPNLKQVEIDVQYTKPGMQGQRTYTTTAFISSYR